MVTVALGNPIIVERRAEEQVPDLSKAFSSLSRGGSFSLLFARVRERATASTRMVSPLRGKIDQPKYSGEILDISIYCLYYV